MKQIEDFRIRKTKTALFNAFFDMLEEMTFDELTINNLCDRAGIRRATFYKHYVDKYDFLINVTRALRDRFDTFRWTNPEGVTTKEYFVAYAKRVVGFINENDKVIANMIKSDLLPTVYSIVTEQNYVDTKELLTKMHAEGKKLKGSPDVVAAMLVGSVSTAIYGWLLDGKPKDADMLADEIGTILWEMI